MGIHAFANTRKDRISFKESKRGSLIANGCINSNWTASSVLVSQCIAMTNFATLLHIYFTVSGTPKCPNVHLTLTFSFDDYMHSDLRFLSL